jgi:hypothetical protein
MDTFFFYSVNLGDDFCGRLLSGLGVHSLLFFVDARGQSLLAPLFLQP